MNNKEPILEFHEVTLPAGTGDGGAGAPLSFRAGGGDLVLIRTARPHLRWPLADAAEGLAPPLAGTVTFLGRDWTAMGASESVAARARIGRVFQGAAWIGNLDVDENITLRERHFTTRAAADIEAEARALARAVGLEDLPRLRPAWMERHDLARAQWVRALLGRPALLLLEFPEQDATDEGLAALRSAVGKARTEGAAIVWFTSDPRVWNDKGINADISLAVNGQ